MSGALIDANQAESGMTLPVVGATIRVGSTTAVTDNFGMFSLSVAPGVYAFEIDASTAAADPSGNPYTDYANAITIADGTGPLDLGIFHATPRTTFTSIVIPSLTTTVGNPDLDALVPGSTTSLVIVPNSAIDQSTGLPYSGQISITRVPNCCTPSSMPQFVQDANPLIVTVQPLGITFDPPAPLSLPNTGGDAPGTTLDLWSLNPDTGTFEVVGTGRVSVDGTTIETISGGLRQTDWHFFIAPPTPIGSPFTVFCVGFGGFRVPAGITSSVDIGDCFVDPDGDLLTFTITDDGGWGATIDPLNGIISGPPLGIGESRVVTVQASDGALTASRTFQIVGTVEPIYTGPFDLPWETAEPDGSFQFDFGPLFDNPGATPLVFSLDNGIESLPATGASIDPVTGLFSVNLNEVDAELGGFWDFAVVATNEFGSTGIYFSYFEIIVAE